MGLGLAALADPASFSWAGPWMARVRAPGDQEPRFVVMYGVPSGVAWDPSAVTSAEGWAITDGYLVAPGDVALAGRGLEGDRHVAGTGTFPSG